MTFASLFAGIGGFDLALERLGHQCVYANDNDRYCKIIYERQFKTRLDPRDIRSVPTTDIPDHDILVGGFPCQSFSITGRRGGFEDTRGTLFFEIARIAKAKRPPYLLLENVRGLLSHDGGETFKVILRTLDELGYDVQWQLLNSKDFGVAQNRERTFIIGILRDVPWREVFPLTGSPTANRSETSGLQPKIVAQNQRGEVREMTLAGTLTAQRSGKQFQYVNGERNLTPTEYELLQGFPPGWTAWGFQIDPKAKPGEDPHRTVFVSDTQRFKMLGNAVTVPVIETIAHHFVGLGSRYSSGHSIDANGYCNMGCC